MGRKQILVKALAICMSVATFSVASVSSAQAKCTVQHVPGASAALDHKKPINQSVLDRAVLAEINYHRCLRNRQPLQFAPQMRGAALGHSAWMAQEGELSHNSRLRGKRTVVDRMQSEDISARSYAENLALVPLYQLQGRFRVLNYRTCQFVSANGQQIQPHSYASLSRRVVGLWMESRGHRRNILDPKLRFLSSAAVVDNSSGYCGDLYITQVFAG